MINLIIDGNYLLLKNTFVLAKHNSLYGMLHKSLEKTLSSYRSLYSFDNIFFVSDSKSSWRKNIYPDYKASRKKDDSIDWEFVYTAYNEFKNDLPKNVKVLESNSIEGDDWTHYLVDKYNKEGYSNLIISNDYDIKQLVECSSSPFYINIMSNEIFNREKVFIPHNYSIYMNFLKENFSTDIFELNDNNTLYNFLDSFILKRDIHLTDKDEALFLKVISGDASDNIKSPYQAIQSNGKIRGIGDSGAKKLYELYIKEFGEVNFSDTDFSDNISDLILETKKLPNDNLKIISDRVKSNLNLIRLSQMPQNIKDTMNNHFNSLFTKQEDLF